MTNLLKLSMIAAPSLLLASCAQSGNPPMDAGQRISQRGDAISGYGDAWFAGEGDVRKGQEMVQDSLESMAQGEKRLEKARKEFAEAEAQVQAAQLKKTNGDQLIAGGRAQMERAEAGYSSVRDGPSAVIEKP